MSNLKSKFYPRRIKMKYVVMMIISFTLVGIINAMLAVISLLLLLVYIEFNISFHRTHYIFDPYYRINKRYVVEPDYVVDLNTTHVDFHNLVQKSHYTKKMIEFWNRRVLMRLMKPVIHGTIVLIWVLDYLQKN